MSSPHVPFNDYGYRDAAPPSLKKVDDAKEAGDLYDYSMALIAYLNYDGFDADGSCSLLYDLDCIAPDCRKYFPDNKEAFDEVITHLLGNANSESVRDRILEARQKETGIGYTPPEGPHGNHDL